MEAITSILTLPVTRVWLDFIRDIVGHLVWPATLMFAVLLFRSQIQRIFNDVSHFKFGGAELEIGRDAKELVSEAVSAGITVMYPSAMNSLSSIGSIREVVLSQWIDIEEIIDKLWRKNSGALPAQRHTAVTLKIDELRRGSIINSELASLLIRIMRLRNDLVHSNEVNFTDDDRAATIGAIRSVKDRLQQALSK